MVHFQVSNAHISWNSFQRFWLNHLRNFHINAFLSTKTTGPNYRSCMGVKGAWFHGYLAASSAATSLMEHLRPVLYQLLDNLLRRIWGGASCRPYLELCDVSHVVGDVEPRPIIHVLGDVDPGPSFCSMLWDIIIIPYTNSECKQS
jgi:hypothetical protein